MFSLFQRYMLLLPDFYASIVMILIRCDRLDQEFWRQRETECLRGCGIDDQFEIHGLLDR
jgi:hypothetical protein